MASVLSLGPHDGVMLHSHPACELPFRLQLFKLPPGDQKTAFDVYTESGKDEVYDGYREVVRKLSAPGLRKALQLCEALQAGREEDRGDLAAAKHVLTDLMLAVDSALPPEGIAYVSNVDPDTTLEDRKEMVNDALAGTEKKAKKVDSKEGAKDFKVYFAKPETLQLFRGKWLLE